MNTNTEVVDADTSGSPILWAVSAGDVYYTSLNVANPMI
jgi:hypothetical protein